MDFVNVFIDEEVNAVTQIMMVTNSEFVVLSDVKVVISPHAAVDCHVI